MSAQPCRKFKSLLLIVILVTSEGRSLHSGLRSHASRQRAKQGESEELGDFCPYASNGEAHHAPAANSGTVSQSTRPPMQTLAFWNGDEQEHLRTKLGQAFLIDMSQSNARLQIQTRSSKLSAFVASLFAFTSLAKTATGFHVPQSIVPFFAGTRNMGEQDVGAALFKTRVGSSAGQQMVATLQEASCMRRLSRSTLDSVSESVRASRRMARHSAPAMLAATTGNSGLDALLGQLRPDGLSYWDLHGFLLVPTLWLLTAGKPSLLKKDTPELKRQASSNFIQFILAIAVLQAFVWDSVGARIGIWEFNPEKVTGLGESLALPLEEILWLFHHVIKAALWQLKIADFPIAQQTGDPAPLSRNTRTAGNIAILATGAWGAYDLFSSLDESKCIALVAAFFAPVYLIILNLGERYWLSHWRLFLAGWALPGWWTVAIDCLGQQQGVWNFPERFLCGVSTFDGLLKLDIALVYLVSTFAVTATGGIIDAASDEFISRRRAQGDEAEPTLLDLAKFIYTNSFPAYSQVQKTAIVDNVEETSSSEDSLTSITAGENTQSSGSAAGDDFEGRALGSALDEGSTTSSP